jgi:hypothetical protein
MLNFAVLPKRSWHLLSNPTDYWYIITIAELLCADKFLQITFRYFLKEFKGINIGLKNKRSRFGLVTRPSVYCLLNGVVIHCAFLGGRTFLAKFGRSRTWPNFTNSAKSELPYRTSAHL